jgi:hypothetical protein
MYYTEDVLYGSICKKLSFFIRDINKEQRYSKYLELKKEFEPKPQPPKDWGVLKR